MSSKSNSSVFRWSLLLAVAVVAGLVIRFAGMGDNPHLLPSSTATSATPGEAKAMAVPVDPGISQAGLALNDDHSPGARDGQHQDSGHVRVTRDRAFISYAFPVLSTWDLAALRPLLSAETVAGSSERQMGDVMTVLARRLGKLQYFETPEPASAESTGLPTPEGPDLQHYQFTAYFEAGAAEVDLVLHQQRDASSLYSFNIQVSN